MDPICKRGGCYLFPPNTDERTECEGLCRLAQKLPPPDARLVQLATLFVDVPNWRAADTDTDEEPPR